MTLFRRVQDTLPRPEAMRSAIAARPGETACRCQAIFRAALSAIAGLALWVDARVPFGGTQNRIEAPQRAA